MTRRQLLRAGTAAGALLVAPPLLGGAGALGAPLGPVRSKRLTDRYGTARESRLFPGTWVVHADLHNHTLLSDGDGVAADAFGSMRSAGIDVAAITDHSSVEKGYPGTPTCSEDHTCGRILGINEESWRHLGALVDGADGNGFVAIRGFEWSSPTLGHMNVWFSETWTDPLHTGGVGQGEGAGEFLHIESEGVVTQEQAAIVDGLVRAVPVTGLGMRAFYQWLQLPASTPVIGGGLDGIAGFNHPGREVGRFGSFHHDPALEGRVVSLEVFNRREDYLFEGVDLGSQSPVNQCLNAGWKVGLLGVTDEHGTAWGFEEGKGRAGLWVDGFGRDAVREAMQARRFFATNVLGLRLDALARSETSSHRTRMGGVLQHAAGVVRFDIDLARGAIVPPSGFEDDGADWAGRRLLVQVLRPGTDLLPEIVGTHEVVVPSDGRATPSRRRPRAPISIRCPIDVADGNWVVLRITDPEQPAAEKAAGTPYAGSGKAIAYASPFFLTPSA